MLLNPLSLGPRPAPSRLMFGPHVTNLGDDDRRFTARHTAYYARRAVGGCGVIVTEGASVHDSDWPYERAPLAQRCAAGWSDIAASCHEHGALVIASLDHAGGQGSSAYSQLPLWAPSRVPEVNSRETPKWMEADDIEAVIDGFAAAAQIAVRAGCDGVEINAGQHSLVRQFLSGLTNHRDDSWGQDRLLFARQVIEAVRPDAGLIGLRLCCDELAPWAGMTPDVAPDIAANLVAAGIDYVVVVRGSIYTAEKTRPDFHEPAGFNIDVCRAVKAALASTPVFLQGSVVEFGQAEWAVGEGICDGVEMTRAQIAEPDLVAKLRADQAGAIRPCIRCNQTVPGSRRPQPRRQLCRRADRGPRDGGPRLVRVDFRSRVASWSSVVASPGWRLLGSRPRGDTASHSWKQPTGSVVWQHWPDQAPSSSPGWRPSVAASVSRSPPAPRRSPTAM